MGTFGSEQGKQSTAFKRTGTSVSSKTKDRPSFVRNAGQSLIESSGVSPELAGIENATLASLMSKDYLSMPGMDRLQQFFSLAPDSFVGSPALGSIAGIDPYDTKYTDGLEGFFQNLFQEASANARTGPDAIRGGTAHGAMVEGNVLEKAALDKFREITGLQLQQADVTTKASQILEMLSQGRRGQAMQAQGMSVEEYLKGLGISMDAADAVNKKRQAGTQSINGLEGMFGSESVTNTDNLAGKGNQNTSGSAWNLGLDCCFIFMEALNGQLPWYVRRGRDVLRTDQQALGYRKMSKWLIPLMQRSSLVMKTVNLVMVKPFLCYGKWFFNVEGRRPLAGPLCKPICEVWFKVWNFLGK